jgi:hypothetical protein
MRETGRSDGAYIAEPEYAYRWSHADRFLVFFLVTNRNVLRNRRKSWIVGCFII